MRRAGISVIFLLWMPLAWAGVPTDCPPIADPLLGKWCQSTMDHLNTLECLTGDPNGTVLGRIGDLKCAVFDGCNQVCMNTSSGPSAGTSWDCFCPSSTCPGGSDTYVQYNDASSCGGDEGFTFSESTNLVNINEATDGDSILLRLDNDQANSASSTNETVQIRFGFGNDADVARIVAGKLNDFSTTSNSDALLRFMIDAEGTSTEVMRIWGLEQDSIQPSWGVSIGTTATANAALQVGTVGGTANDVGLLVSSTNLGSPIVDVFKTVADNTVIAGDTDYTSGFTNQTISGGRASIIASGTNAFNSPASLQLVTTSGTTYTSAIEILDIAAPTFQRYAYWSTSNLSSVQSESPVVIFNPTPVQVVTFASATSNATQRSFIFNAQTLNGVAGGATETITDAATVYINNAPSGSNITFTNGPYALWVDDGAVRIDGSLTVGSIDTGGGTALELASGVWTPTPNDIANLDASSSAAEGQYLRVGATVTASVQLTVNPTLTATSTQTELDLPVASNFGATSDAAGSCFSPGVAGQGAAVTADAASDEVEVRWISGDITSQELDCIFSYQVI